MGAGVEEFSREPGARLDFLEIVDAESLEPLETARPGALVAVAGFVGSTRLIDNVVLA
jgi:pantoate--beta-alanine ligase